MLSVLGLAGTAATVLLITIIENHIIHFKIMFTIIRALDYNIGNIRRRTGNRAMIRARRGKESAQPRTG